MLLFQHFQLSPSPLSLTPPSHSIRRMPRIINFVYVAANTLFTTQKEGEKEEDWGGERGSCYSIVRLMGPEFCLGSLLHIITKYCNRKLLKSLRHHLHLGGINLYHVIRGALYLCFYNRRSLMFTGVVMVAVMLEIYKSTLFRLELPLLKQSRIYQLSPLTHTHCSQTY